MVQEYNFRVDRYTPRVLHVLGGGTAAGRPPPPVLVVAGVQTGPVSLDYQGLE